MNVQLQATAKKIFAKRPKRMQNPGLAATPNEDLTNKGLIFFLNNNKEFDKGTFHVVLSSFVVAQAGAWRHGEP